MVKLFLVISVGTIVLSVLFGLLVAAPIMRSIAIGFYLVGCFVLFGAFFGNRGDRSARAGTRTRAACSGHLSPTPLGDARGAGGGDQQRGDLPSTRLRAHPPGRCLGQQALAVLTIS
jgi:hypothetical protein